MGVSCYQVLGITPPVSMAELKTAYRKAAALHHPDRGGNHLMMVQVNDAYEQAKWETERATSKPSGKHQARATSNPRKHHRKPPKSKPRHPQASIWTEIIDELIRRQVQKSYKKAWVAFKLLDSEIKPPVEAWKYLAQRLGYMSGWAWYKFDEWKPVAERDLN